MNKKDIKAELEGTQRTIRFFENLLRASSDGIVITDVANNIVLVNEAFCSFFGINCREVTETSLFVWLEKLDDNAPARWSELEQRVSSGFPCRDIEFRMTLPSERYLSVNASTVEKVDVEEGGVIISVWRDVTDIKRAERSLKKSHDELEERVEARTRELKDLESIINRSPAMVFLWPVNEGWPVEFVSDNVKQILGYTAEDFTSGRVSWPGITHPEDVARLETEVAKYLEEGMPEFSQEYRLITKTGDIRWMRDNNRVLCDSKGTPMHIQSIVLDVTDHKESEEKRKKAYEDLLLSQKANLNIMADLDREKEALRKSEKSLAKAQEITSLGSWEWDVVTNEIVWSDQTYRNLGLEPGEVSPTLNKFFEFIHPADREFVKKAKEQALHDNKSYNIEFRYIRKDGADCIMHSMGDVYADETGKPVRMVGAAQDITERKQSEDAFKTIIESSVGTAGKEFFDNVVASLYEWLDVGLVIIGELIDGGSVKTLSMKLDGKDMEEYSYELKGVPCETVIKKGSYCIYPEGVSQLFPDDKDLIEIGGEGYVGVPLKNKSGNVIGILCAVSRSKLKPPPRLKDVMEIIAAKAAVEIERMQYEEKLLKAKEDAETASRAKSDFLSRMSHELRTPLNSILGFAQIMQSEGGKLDDKQGLCVEEIVSAGWHLTDLVNEVLDISKVESGNLSLNFAPVDICPIMEECINLITPLAEEKNIKVNCNSKVCNKEMIWGDDTRLKEVFLNLLSNAVKYNVDSGTVTISCDKVDEERLLISVADSGKGISEKDQKLLFIPFSRIKGEDPAIQGTGIGLAISKHLVELMGGAIGMESTPGRGSTFWVKLQIAEDASS